jgi:hypothetical protein
MKMQNLMAGVLTIALSSAGISFGADTPAPGGDAPAAIVVPTMDEIKAMVEAGKWQDALKGISRAIPKLKQKDSGYDAYTLHMLSGECQMQLRNVFTAVREYESAIAISKTKEELAAAFATKTLIDKRDTKWRYVPNGKNAEKDGIDILDRAKRDDAIKALAADVMANVNAINRKVLGDRALPPIIQFADSLVDARKIQYAATKSEADFDAIIKGLANHAQQSITNELTAMQRTTDDISRRANERVDVNQNVPDPANPGRMIQRRVQMRRGLQGTDAQNLSNVINTCRLIPGAINDLRKALGDAANFNNAANDANRISNRANDVLRDNYTRP